MKKMNMLSAILILTTLVFLTACATNPPAASDLPGTTGETPPATTVTPPATTPPTDPRTPPTPPPTNPPTPPTPPPATPPTGTVKEFTMEAKQFEFIPSEVKVKKGDTVRLKITATDVAHGFAISEFGVNEQLPVGQEVTVEFVADKKGTFSFTCSVFCGSGHRTMKGTLIVE